ncbi:uncharacterized protein LOC124495592 [Dermatophagoides farinae]|uniref:Uncharacterized protein n=1 Tax=Dermatophagoides farinae TaxID=6954 RepID=A0A922L8F2_DERFA|nr:hypothetical protein DERF_000205 [Dermatophagoides farinae]
MLMKILLIFSAISLIYSMDQNELMSAKKSKVNGNNDDNLLIRSPIIDLGNDWYQESIVKDPEYHDKLNRKILLRRLLAQLNSNAETLIEKEKREDDIPPGFIGVRGRRFPFTLRDLRSLFHLVPNQKKDASSIYRDGFLGVRG